MNTKEKQSKLQKRNHRIGKTKEKRKKETNVLQKINPNVTKKKHPLISIKRPKKIIQEKPKRELSPWNNNKKSHQKLAFHLTNIHQKIIILKQDISKIPIKTKTYQKIQHPVMLINGHRTPKRLKNPTKTTTKLNRGNKKHYKQTQIKQQTIRIKK